MSIAIPNNKKEKWARYQMLIKQNSMTYIQAKAAYIKYLRNTNQ